MMRAIAIATLFAATLAAPPTFAQASSRHYPICLRAATGLKCAFRTMAQCRQAAVGTSGICIRKPLPLNHPLRRR